MSLSRERAAQALGMKQREIVTIERGDGGYVVTTHDSRRYLVTAGGQITAPDDAEASGKSKGRQTRRQPKTPETTSRVPAGTAEEILAWVDGDAERAAAAYAAEVGREQPREDLAKALEKLAA